jgi:predicted nucleic acid-binding protein
VISLDTSLLVDALAGPRRSLPVLMRVLDSGEIVGLCSMVAYEWLRGPRTQRELDIQEGLLPLAAASPFGAADAEIAARLYKSVRRARSREADIAIAACAIRQNAELWTLNRSNFADIPGLRLFSSKA